MKKHYKTILGGVILALILIIFTKKINIKANIFGNYSIEYTATDTRPVFNNKNIDRLIDEYISSNSCKDLEYEVFDVDKYRVNVFLDCGKPISYLYNTKDEQLESIESIIKDKYRFKSIVDKLLKYKYPYFVADEVDIFKSNYKINDRELTLYYDTDKYRDVSIKINNNEIRGLMKYDMKYDKEYTNEVYTIDKNKKTIAFTFDDGPTTLDLSILDILNSTHSRATFFVVGERLKNYSDVVKKLVDSKMEIGNHSYTHGVMTKESNTVILDEISKTNSIYKDITGLNMTLFRAPYGSIDKRVLASSGMVNILWSIDTEDWKNRNANKIVENIMGDVKDGDIVLMHSLYEPTKKALKEVIPKLYLDGYQIVGVEELFKIKGIPLVSGNKYSSAKK